MLLHYLIYKKSHFQKITFDYLLSFLPLVVFPLFPEAYDSILKSVTNIHKAVNIINRKQNCLKESPHAIF